MHILCTYSGLEFNCEFFPGYFSSREAHHPVFHLPQKKLISTLGKWSAGELTPIDSYLLFLGLLHSTELIVFREPVNPSEKTFAAVACCMEELAQTVIKMNAVSHPRARFPHFVVSQGNRELENVHWWIESWKDAYKAFKENYRTAAQNQRLERRERALEYFIKSPLSKPTVLSTALGEWADVAGSFPTYMTPVKVPGTNKTKNMPLNEYWKDMIRRMVLEDQLFQLEEQDLKELLEHCENSIPVGSIYSHKLFSLLRGTIERQKNYLGMGDIDLAKLSQTPYAILPEDATVQDANFMAMVNSAPSEEPKPHQYPTKLEYVKARAKWTAAKEFHSYRKDLPGAKGSRDDDSDLGDDEGVEL